MQKQVRRQDDERVDPAQDLRRRIDVLVARVRELGAIVTAEMTYSPGAIRLIGRVHVELERAVARLVEAERAWNDWTNGSGRAGGEPGAGGDIDFDAARYEIGCRLARLRECCRSD